jgi:flagellar motor switch protein FliN/FliY
MTDIENEWAKVSEKPLPKNSSTQETNDLDVDWAAALDEQHKTEAEQKDSPHATGRHDPPPDIEKSSAHLDQSPKTLGIEMILHIPVELSVILGETKLLVNDLVQLGQGSIVELNKLATRAMDLMVNDRLLGTGEVVVINEHFGVRLTEIIPPQDRIKNLA